MVESCWINDIILNSTRRETPMWEVTGLDLRPVQRHQWTTVGTCPSSSLAACDGWSQGFGVKPRISLRIDQKPLAKQLVDEMNTFATGASSCFASRGFNLVTSICSKSGGLFYSHLCWLLLLFEAHETLDLQFCWFYPLGKNTAFAKTIPSNTFVGKPALRSTKFVGRTSHFDD